MSSFTSRWAPYRRLSDPVLGISLRRSFCALGGVGSSNHGRLARRVGDVRYAGSLAFGERCRFRSPPIDKE